MKRKVTFEEDTSENIIDNTDKSMGDWLNNNIQQNDELRFVSAYFTIYGYESIKSKIENAQLRFLFGDSTNVGEVDPAPDEDKSFIYDNVEQKLQSENPLSQKWIAEQCEKWVRKDTTQIKTLSQGNFLHGKMYHLDHKDGSSQAVNGSSNLTKNGLGMGSGSNLELNLIAEEKATDQLATWFDDLWHDESKVEDAKERVIEALKKLGNDRSPQFIYFKTLYHYFEDRLKLIQDNQESMDKVDFKETAIWKKLYPFQRQGVKGAINRLTQYNGCIIADSVGLGKTYSALAVIKYYELKRENVLVLCPKRLRDNWTRYPVAFANTNNILAEDSFQYHVLSHTDLGRESGDVDGINLANFDWGKYSLVVIDESHNFRNIPSKRKTAEGEERISRYELLINKVINAGVATKVLMLSATPVNNKLKDLTNQIHIISGGNDDYFSQQGLEIPSVKNVMHIAQRKFDAWQKIDEKQRKKQSLISELNDDFFRLLDGLSIARSRKHIIKFYPEFLKNGSFPKRNDPIDLNPSTDNENILNYKDMAERIGKFKLAIYHPADYLSSDSELINQFDKEKKKFNFTQIDRERHLIQMMKVIYLKRLESSVAAFKLTIARAIKKMDAALEGIKKHQSKADNIIDSDTPSDADDFEDDEDFIDGGKVWRYRYKDLKLDEWQADLKKERQVLQGIYDISENVTPDRDEKLVTLCKELKKKLSNKKNRKVLVFTTYADTAKYLYDQLEEWVKQQNGQIAQIAGSGSVRSTIGKPDYQEILNRFAPHGREHKDFKIQKDKQIDILIATDCISEGQNLQDCDTVINYDIHWNPVRLIQRFGRIDRLNSENKSLNTINFWPPMELDEILKLRARVSARMELANVAATGQDNILKPKEQLQMEIDFRYKQFKEGYAAFDNEDKDGIEISDFTQEDFLAELLSYIDSNGKELENAPFGLFAVTHQTTTARPSKTHPTGAIFCLRHKLNAEQKKGESLPPCRLVYIDDMNKLYPIGQSALTIMRDLSRDRDKVISKLARKFDKKTDNGKKIADENKKMIIAIDALNKQYRKNEAKHVSAGGSFGSRQVRNKNADDYQLLSWLVITE